MQLQCPLSTEGFQPRGCQNALNKSPGIVLSLAEVCSQLGRAGRWGEAAHPSPWAGEGFRADLETLPSSSLPWIWLCPGPSSHSTTPAGLSQGHPGVLDVTSRSAGGDFEELWM